MSMIGGNGPHAGQRLAGWVPARPALQAWSKSQDHASLLASVHDDQLHRCIGLREPLTDAAQAESGR